MAEKIAELAKISMQDMKQSMNLELNQVD